MFACKYIGYRARLQKYIYSFQIFVTSPESEVKLVINQKATEVQNYVAQIQR